jgi:hypothetical protein
MLPQQIEEDPHRTKRRAIDERRKLDIRSAGEAILREDGGGERQQCRTQQQQQVAHQQHMVAATDIMKHRVVIVPDHADLEEAQHIRVGA